MHLWSVLAASRRISIDLAKDRQRYENHALLSIKHLWWGSRSWSTKQEGPALRYENKNPCSIPVLDSDHAHAALFGPYLCPDAGRSIRCGQNGLQAGEAGNYRKVGKHLNHAGRFKVWGSLAWTPEISDDWRCNGALSEGLCRFGDHTYWARRSVHAGRWCPAEVQQINRQSKKR